MDVFKFMCKRIFDEEDTVMYEDGSQIRENREGANKKRKNSDDPLDTSNAPLTGEKNDMPNSEYLLLEKLSNGDDNNCNKVEKMMKELENLIKSNTSPSQGTTMQFSCHQMVSPKQIVQSERQITLPNQSIQQVRGPKQLQYMRQNTMANQSIQQVEVPKQLQFMRQNTLPNQSFQQVAVPKQIKYVRQNTLPNQSIQKLPVPIQPQLLRQPDLPNQSIDSIQQVAMPKQIVQTLQQNTFPNQSIINEVVKVEKRGAQSYEILSWEPRAFLYHNFLSKEECEHMIKLAKPYLQRSLLRDRLTGKGIVSSGRTSFGANLKRGYDEIIKNVEKRIAETTFIPIENGEHLHVLRYEVGQKIVPHHDYFYDLKFDTTNSGQRIATFLMYLSPAEEGGETIFPLAKGNITNSVSQQIKKGVVVKPKLGDAVLFWSVKPDGTLDPSSLHSGVPVIKGNKWCCTKFMRAKEYKV